MLPGGRKDGGNGGASIVRRVRRRLLWLPGLLLTLGALAAWQVVPSLFELDRNTIQDTRALFALLVVGTVAVGSLISLRSTRPMARLAGVIDAGEPPGEALLATNVSLVAWHPRLLALAVTLGGLAIVGTLAVYGHEQLDLPTNLAWVATGAGACITVWLALILAASQRVVLIPFTRVLSQLGRRDWPGARTTVTRKITGYMVAASFISAVLVGTVAYQFADGALTRQLGEDMMVRLPQTLEWTQQLHDLGSDPARLAQAIANAQEDLGPRTRLALLHHGRLVAGDREMAAAVRANYRFRHSGGEGGSAVLPHSLDIAAWAPLQAPGYVGMALTDREVIRNRFASSGLEVGAVVVLTMLLGGALGLALSRSMRAPLRDMVGSTTRIAEGDLTRPRTQVLGDDEFGEVTERVEVMRSRLASTVARVAAQARTVADSAHHTLGGAEALEADTGRQGSAADAAAAAVEEIDSSIRAFAEALADLTAIFRDNTRSAGEVGGDLDRVAGDLRDLAQGAQAAASGVVRFSDDGERVAQEVVGLSGVVERARGAWDRVHDGLGRVQADARQAAATSLQTRRTAEAGAAEVRSTVEAIGRIREQARTTAGEVEALTQRIAEVERVLGVIDDIAERTGLLALNASIIAAQAGEQGKSFAVVADQVRDLARQTAASTREISTTIQDVQAAGAGVVEAIHASGQGIDDGVSRAGKAETALREILQSVAASVGAAEGIASTATAQSRNVEVASHAFEEVATVADRITALAADQVQTGRGVRERVADMAGLAEQMSRAVAKVASRNRGLLDSYRTVQSHMDRLEKGIAELGDGSRAIVEQTMQIQDTVEGGIARSGDLRATAEALDGAAASLLEEMATFRLDPQDVG